MVSRQSVRSLLLLLTFVGSARGADLINTLSASSADIEYAELSGYFVAQSFQTTQVDRFVTDVVLKLRTDATEGSLRVDIYDAAGTGGSPGALVANIYDSDLSGISTGTYTEFAVSGLFVQLDALETYYVVASGSATTPNQSNVFWSYTSSPPPGSGGENSEFWSGVDGSSWDDQIIGEPQLLRVVAVPEPSTYVLSVLAVMALVGAYRRRPNADPSDSTD